jgi:hypothetical protein
MNPQTDIGSFLGMLLTMGLSQAPVFLVSVVALILIFARWKQAPTACLWASLGFGLRLLICIGFPVVQTIVTYARMHGQHTDPFTGVVLSSLNVLWSALGAVSYALMLVAVFAGRPKPGP